MPSMTALGCTRNRRLPKSGQAGGHGSQRYLRSAGRRRGFPERHAQQSWRLCSTVAIGVPAISMVSRDAAGTLPRR